MIFPYEKRVWRNRMQPTNGRQTENEKAQIKKQCKLAGGVKAERDVKQTGVEKGLGVYRQLETHFTSVFSSLF